MSTPEKIKKIPLIYKPIQKSQRKRRCDLGEELSFKSHHFQRFQEAIAPKDKDKEKKTEPLDAEEVFSEKLVYQVEELRDDIQQIKETLQTIPEIRETQKRLESYLRLLLQKSGVELNEDQPECKHNQIKKEIFD